MLQKELPFLTKISKATTKSDSIRTTIPKEIADNLGLEIHDVLIWEVDDEKITIKKWETDKQ